MRWIENRGAWFPVYNTRYILLFLFFSFTSERCELDRFLLRSPNKQIERQNRWQQLQRYKNVKKKHYCKEIEINRTRTKSKEAGKR